MRRYYPRSIVFCASACLSVICVSPLMAQDQGQGKALQAVEASQPAEEKEKEFSVKVYRFPSKELQDGFVVREKGQLRAPGLPDEKADRANNIEFLRLSHGVIVEYFNTLGVQIPNGSLATYDPENLTLVLRSDKKTHEYIGALALEAQSRVPNHLAFQFSIIESDAGVMREALKKSYLTHDHTVVLDELLKNPQTKEIDTVTAEARSGQRITASSVTQFRHATDYVSNRNGWTTSVMDDWPHGTTIELDPILSSDGRTFDLNFSVEHDYSAPHERWENIAQKGQDQLLARMTDVFHGVSTTSITMVSGTTRLVSVWTPQGVNAEDHANKLQAIFITGDIVPLLAKVDNRLEQLVSNEGKDIKPSVASTIEDTLPLPAGMILKRFIIPQNFLSDEHRRDVGGASSDPFAAPGGRATSEAMISVRMTAKDILMARGISFPAGASANYSPGTGELIVRNTPENIGLVEAYIQEMRGGTVHQLVCTLHIVQADTAFIRELVHASRGQADHSDVWAKVEAASQANQNGVKFLNSLKQEIRSGQRAVIQAGPDYLTNIELGLAEEKNKAKDGKNKADEISDAPGFTVDTDRYPAGARFEIDPVMGGDRRTVDVNFGYEYHMAPPSFRQAEADTLKLSVPMVNFHKASFSGSSTVLSGMTRMLNIWKPRGSAELENADVLQAAFLRVDVVPVE